MHLPLLHGHAIQVAIPRKADGLQAPYIALDQQRLAGASAVLDRSRPDARRSGPITVEEDQAPGGPPSQEAIVRGAGDEAALGSSLRARDEDVARTLLTLRGKVVHDMQAVGRKIHHYRIAGVQAPQRLNGSIVHGDQRDLSCSVSEEQGGQYPGPVR